MSKNIVSVLLDSSSIELLPKWLRDELQQAVDEILSLRQRVVSWEPIASAPKDGTEIIATWDSGPEKDCVVVVSYCEGLGSWYSEDWCCGRKVREPTRWILKSKLLERDPCNQLQEI